MLYDRRERILEKLSRDGMVKVSELIAEFSVSSETIRRDLESMEKENLLRRVYGGAVSVSRRGQEVRIEDRETSNYEEKKAIGQRAVDLVDDGDVIMIDLGTTTLEFAKALAGKKRNLTVITNSIPVALTLSDDDNIRVYIIGGQVRKSEHSVSGNLADENARLFQTDKVFLGIGGLTEEFGATDYHVEETAFRRICIRRTRSVIVLSDSTKFGVTAMNQICELKELRAVVTNREAERSFLNMIRSKGVEVLLA